MLRERIINQAADFFSQYGIKSVSMDDLATSLGVSKRTLYEHFKDKEEILLHCMQAKRDERNQKIMEIVNSSENVIEVFLYILEYHRDRPFPNTKFYEDVYKYYPKIYQNIIEDNEKSKIYLKKFLNQGIKTGYIRKNLNVDVAAFLVEESTYTNMRAAYLEKPPFSLQEMFFTMMVNFIRGISTYKGIEIIDEYLAKFPNNNK